MQNLNPKLQQAFQSHQNGQLNDAEKLYKELVAEGSADTTVYSNLAGVLSQQGKAKEAIQLLKSASTASPNDTGITLALSQTYLSVGDTLNSKQLLNSLLLRFPTMGEAHYLLGNIYLQENNLESSIFSFKSSIQSMPQFAEAHYALGVAYSQKGELEEAEKQWKDLTAWNPNFLLAWMSLGSLEIDRGDYQQAINYLDRVLAIDPDHFSAIKLKGMALHAQGKIDEALKLYLKIHKEENPSEEILTLVANANRDLDRIEAAESLYIKVLKINPENKIAKENLEKLDSRKIEGWHFSMLGDLSRNEGYHEAIQRKVKQGDTVLDIGTGSGLLSMMCAKAGAQKVYTCETIVAIADAAKNVIKDNRFEEQIEVFNMKSNRLKIGEEIPEKVDVLVSEILDLGLLGEGVLPSIRDAKANLLKECGTIIPCGAQVKAVLIQSDHLKKVDPIKDISGFDLRSFGKFQVDHSYRQAILNVVPHLKLSDVFDALPIDFYNLPPIAAFDNPNLHPLNIEIKADGELHGIVFWFNLHLDEQLSLSSGPDGEMIHWGQAVCCFEEPKKVKVGDIVSLQAEQSEMKIVFKLK